MANKDQTNKSRFSEQIDTNKLPLANKGVGLEQIYYAGTPIPPQGLIESATISPEQIQKAIGNTGLEGFRPDRVAKGIQGSESPQSSGAPMISDWKDERPIEDRNRVIVSPSKPNSMKNPPTPPELIKDRVSTKNPPTPPKLIKEIQKVVSPYGTVDPIKPTKEIKRVVPREPRRDFMDRQNVMLKRELTSVEKRLGAWNREQGRLQRMIRSGQEFMNNVRAGKGYSDDPNWRFANKSFARIKQRLGSLFNQRREISRSRQTLINRRSEIMNQFDRGRLSNFGKR